MNSRKIRPHYSLLLFSLSGSLSGCLFGENKTYFDYRETNGAAKSDVSTSNHPTTNDQNNGSDQDPSNSNDPGEIGNTDSGISNPYCCNLMTGSLIPASQTGCDQGQALTPVSSNDECQNLHQQSPANYGTSTEQFPLKANSKKKIDFLFVVDNSGSMEDNQSKLADGFEIFANTFFRRSDLDICISIITSDRYLGRSAPNDYSKERTVPCTNAEGWGVLNEGMRNAYLNEVIRDFKNKVKVGTRGNKTELIGKSLVTYLYGLDQWGDEINKNTHTDFFRNDSVANISILTDENNWYFRNPEMPEYRNDIPVVQNASVYNSPTMAVDARKGIKDYLDEFFEIVQPGHAPSYSVSTFLQTMGSSTTFPGLSMNLSPLSTLVGRESAMTNITGDTDNFTNLYQGISENLVKRASAIHMAHAIEETLFVKIQNPNQSVRFLTPGVDYTVQSPDGIILSGATEETLIDGDVLIVQYNYRLNQ